MKIIFLLLALAILLEVSNAANAAERCSQEIFIKNQIGDLRFGAIYDPPKGSDYSVWFPVLPRALAVDSQGNVYVGDSVKYRVMKFDKHGKFLLKFPLQPPKRTKKPELSHEIRSIALDINDNVYVLNLLEYRVEIYSPSGQYLRKIDYYSEKIQGLNTDRPRDKFKPFLANIDLQGNIYLVGGKDKQSRPISGAIYNSSGTLVKRGVAAGVNYDAAQMVGASPYTADISSYAPDKKLPGKLFFRVKVNDRLGAVVAVCEGVENLAIDENGPAIELDRNGNIYSFDNDDNVVMIRPE